MNAAARAQIIELISNDLLQAGERANKYQEDELERRNYFRIYFSGVDCLLSVLASEILSIGNVRDFYDTRELAKLMECRYDPATDTVARQVSFQKTSDRLKFVLPKSAFVRGRHFVFPYTAGWNSFLKAVEKRNRITHPKLVDDYSVGVADFENMILAKVWLRDEVLAQLVDL